jgi:hypothetical protein
MSEQGTGANERHDDATAANSTTEHDHDDEPEVASFEEGMAVAAKEYEKRKTRTYKLPDGRVWEFTFKKLTGSERDEAEDAAVNVEEHRNKQEIKTDTGALKTTLIKNGVVSGPPGYKGAERQIAQMHEQMPELVDDLADAIENFSTIDNDAKVGF